MRHTVYARVVRVLVTVYVNNLKRLLIGPVNVRYVSYRIHSFLLSEGGGVLDDVVLKAIYH